MEQDEFITKVCSLNTQYDFSESLYKGLTKPVDVRCPEHGKFQITPCNLFRGRGCTLCAKKRHQERMTNEMVQAGLRFLARAKEVHGDKYDYTEVEYKGHKSPVTIVCPIHGRIVMTPDSHLVRFGCKQCGIDKKIDQFSLTNSEFISRVIAANSEYSPLDKTSYTGYHARTWFNCSLHGEFMSVASSLMKGKGCQECAKYGYRTSSSGAIYILRSNEMTKVGITNREVSARLKGIEKSRKCGFTEVFSKTFSDGNIPFTIEKQILRELRLTHAQPTEKFDGSTECFYDVDHDWLLARINELIKEHTECQSSTQHQALEKYA